METQKCDFFFQKVGNRRNWILSVPRVSVRREKKSPWLCQYQSCISKWYVNGKVFTSTTTSEPKIRFFSRKFEIEFDLCWRAEINIQVGLTYLSTSGMYRRPFEGRHLVFYLPFVANSLTCDPLFSSPGPSLPPLSVSEMKFICPNSEAPRWCWTKKNTCSTGTRTSLQNSPKNELIPSHPLVTGI